MGQFAMHGNYRYNRPIPIFSIQFNMAASLRNNKKTEFSA